MQEIYFGSNVFVLVYGMFDTDVKDILLTSSIIISLINLLLYKFGSNNSRSTSIRCHRCRLGEDQSSSRDHPYVRLRNILTYHEQSRPD